MRDALLATAPRAWAPPAVRGNRRRRAAGHRHRVEAAGIGRPDPAHRRLPLGHAGLPAERGRGGTRVLGHGARGDAPRLRRARPARGPVGHGRGAQGAHSRPPARLFAAASMPCRSSRWCRSRRAACRCRSSWPRSTGSTTSGWSAWRPRRSAARCCATSRAVTRGRIRVGLASVPLESAARRPARHRQPGGVHHRAVPQQPAGHHRPGRRPRRHCRRRHERHPQAGAGLMRLTAFAPGSVGNVGPGPRRARPRGGRRAATGSRPNCSTCAASSSATRAIPTFPPTPRATARRSPPPRCCSAPAGIMGWRSGCSRDCRSRADRAGAPRRRWPAPWPRMSASAVRSACARCWRRASRPRQRWRGGTPTTWPPRCSAASCWCDRSTHPMW